MVVLNRVRPPQQHFEFRLPTEARRPLAVHQELDEAIHPQPQRLVRVERRLCLPMETRHLQTRRRDPRVVARSRRVIHGHHAMLRRNPAVFVVAPSRRVNRCHLAMHQELNEASRRQSQRVEHRLLVEDRLIEDRRPRAVQQETRRLLGRRLLLERVENRLLPRRASRKAKRS